MDLYAFLIGRDEKVMKYINENYGNIPRFRGVRFMKIECANENPEDDGIKMYNKYCGKDVIYIHTRCGDCEKGFDSKDSNYAYYGADKWEESHKDLFLEHCSDDYDDTYCDHYFKAVLNDEYESIIKNFNREE